MRIKTLAATLVAFGAVALLPTAAQAQSQPQQCIFQPSKVCWNDNTGSVTRSAATNVGAGKLMINTPTLYRSGLFILDSYASVSNPFYGMRPKSFVVVLDNAGRPIWVTKLFENPTLCGVLDPSCASNRRDVFVQGLPQQVGQLATDLRIYTGDTPYYTDLREAMKTTIQVANDISPIIKAIVALMV